MLTNHSQVTPAIQARHDQELSYINSINPEYPGACYCHSAEIFTRYCEMQANAAQRDLCFEVATQMRQS